MVALPGVSVAGVQFVALVLFLVGGAVPYALYEGDALLVEAKVGMWRTKTKDALGDKRTGDTLDAFSNDDFIRAIRAFYILSVLFMAASMAPSILNIKIASLGADALAALFALLDIILIGAYFHEELPDGLDWEYRWGFYLMLVGMILMWLVIGCIGGFVGKKEEDGGDENPVANEEPIAMEETPAEAPAEVEKEAPEAPLEGKQLDSEAQEPAKNEGTA